MHYAPNAREDRDQKQPVMCCAASEKVSPRRRLDIFSMTPPRRAMAAIGESKPQPRPRRSRQRRLRCKPNLRRQRPRDATPALTTDVLATVLMISIWGYIGLKGPITIARHMSNSTSWIIIARS